MGEQTGRMPGSAIVLARGRFDQVKIEALMREHGAQVEDYKGSRLVVGDAAAGPRQRFAGVSRAGPRCGRHERTHSRRGRPEERRREHLDQRRDDGSDSDIDSGNAWAAGRFDALTSQAHLPAGVAQQLPTITLFSASATIDSGIRGTLRAESRDDVSADSLRDVVRGFLALARLQASSRPELATVLQSLQLGGTGKTVSLSFDLPATALDALSNLRHLENVTPIAR